VIVIDASVLANAIGDDGVDGRLARSELRTAAGAVAAPDLVDVETTAVLRKRWLARAITDRRFLAAVKDLQALDLDRYPTLPLMIRVYQLRANLTAYDATYVALAEGLGCELLTGDVRLATAPGPRCPIRLLR
jgi:predicted nucleic acid-binding protein